MSNRELTIKKINLAEKIDFSPFKMKINRIKSSILFKSRSKQLPLEKRSSVLIGDEFHTALSVQNLRNYESLPSKKSDYRP